jgi:hypothetical protein
MDKKNVGQISDNNCVLIILILTNIYPVFAIVAKDFIVNSIKFNLNY